MLVVFRLVAPSSAKTGAPSLRQLSGRRCSRICRRCRRSCYRLSRCHGEERHPPIAVIHVADAVVENRVGSPGGGLLPGHLSVDVVTAGLGVIRILQPGDVEIGVVDQAAAAVGEGGVGCATQVRLARRARMGGFLYMVRSLLLRSWWALNRRAANRGPGQERNAWSSAGLAVNNARGLVGALGKR